MAEIAGALLVPKLPYTDLMVQRGCTIHQAVWKDADGQWWTGEVVEETPVDCWTTGYTFENVHPLKVGTDG